LLRLRTVEDVFLLLWGTDRLTCRTQDLKQIALWTAREPDWPCVLQLHHAIHSKPRGKPTYRLIAQKRGAHAYRRVDALKALARGLEGKLPASWKPAAENAALEVWLTINGPAAVCGVRLSDRSMRHREYKEEHMPASLRPVVAAAMVRLAEVQSGMRVVDPMCGVGTILSECLAMVSAALVLGGDREWNALRATDANLRHFDGPLLVRWDARRLPLPDASFDRLISNPPFGKQLGDIETIDALYDDMVQEASRVLKGSGRAVYLVMEFTPLARAAQQAGWRLVTRLCIRLLGQPAIIAVYQT
jgi:tRNA (guanine6-N2)-methyltransferase